MATTKTQKAAAAPQLDADALSLLADQMIADHAGDTYREAAANHLRAASTFLSIAESSDKADKEAAPLVAPPFAKPDEEKEPA